MPELEPIVWNPCPDCVVALRYVLEARGANAMALAVGPLIRMCLECSKIIPDGDVTGRRIKLNLPDEDPWKVNSESRT